MFSPSVHAKESVDRGMRELTDKSWRPIERRLFANSSRLNTSFGEVVTVSVRPLEDFVSLLSNVCYRETGCIVSLGS
jgi:hypothetical protein